VDAKQIMTYRLIKKEQGFPLVDLVYQSNSRFLGSLPQLGHADAELENPYHAAGQVFSVSCLDTLLVQEHFNKGIVKLIEKLVNGTVFYLCVKEISPDLVDKPYESLFHHLLTHQLVPLALYRQSPNRLKYVVTSPANNTVVKSTDFVIVVDRSKVKPKSTRVPYISEFDSPPVTLAEEAPKTTKDDSIELHPLQNDT